MAYKTSASATGSSTAPSATIGAAAANDILIWIVGADTGVTITVPTGFTELSHGPISAPDNQTWCIGWKRAAGGETALTGTVAGSTDWACGVVTFDGRDTGNPPVLGTVTTNTTANASPVTVTAPAVTAVAGDDICMFVVPDTTQPSATHAFTASDYTERIDKFAAIFAGVGAFTTDNVSAGTTGTKNATLTLTSGTSGWASGLVRVPAAAASDTLMPQICL